VSVQINTSILRYWIRANTEINLESVSEFIFREQNLLSDNGEFMCSTTSRQPSSAESSRRVSRNSSSHVERSVLRFILRAREGRGHEGDVVGGGTELDILGRSSYKEAERCRWCGLCICFFLGDEQDG